MAGLLHQEESQKVARSLGPSETSVGIGNTDSPYAQNT